MADQRVELSIRPETLFYILVKAREFSVKTAPSEMLSGSNPGDDQEKIILEDQPNDPTYQELMSAMNDLNEGEQIDLITLVWLGRGDFPIEEWDNARDQALAMTHRHIPQYLSQTPLFSDFLEEGLSKLGRSLEEYEVNRL